MQKSDQINELASALAKAQAEMSGASKDAANPFYKSKYADLKSIIEATRPALTKNGIAVIQAPRFVDGCVEVETMLAHSSGQWMSETLRVIVSKQDAQGIGSATQYGRRYGYGAFVGVYAEDDDGNAAVGKSNNYRQPKQALPPTKPDGEIIPASLDRDAPENSTPPWDSEVQDYSDWLADNPKIGAVNAEIHAAVLKLPQPTQDAVAELFFAYGRTQKWGFDKKSKTFKEPANVTA